MELFSYPLMAAVVGNLAAQTAKGVVQAITHRSISPDVIFASGGMPSSHSSTVAALTMAIGLHEGFGSSLFALSFIFMSVVAYDAMGVRLAAGKHAAALNILMDEFMQLRQLAFSREPNKGKLVIQRFRERIGHSVGEVFTGLAFGAVIAYGLQLWWTA
ncbi:divergent PAP2 family protein [Reinekea sp. G2M2-21]|uniref:divergent PAP2 family protein n=1 Tax=Reinekea sp. G2M2-21 TaxID=2788942 RepID=UPI0018AC42D5|nr:divergent PAP2 family protein [Reinekea sp. G2M2-21]